ncbi:MAG: hypothetical protein IPQ09_23025 [Myxococcales bacterium]|nr:hypothetical protein [Myxococcales bacterium]
MRAIPGMADLQSNMAGQPSVRVRVDATRPRAPASPWRRSPSRPRLGFEGDEAGKMRQGKDQVPIRVRLGRATAPRSTTAVPRPCRP